MFLVEDETKLVDRYDTSTTREVRLLAIVEKLYIYIQGQPGGDNPAASATNTTLRK